MPDCDKYIELISAALDGACSPAELDELKAHLMVCPHCRALCVDLKKLQDAMVKLPAAKPPADLKERIMAAIEADNVTPLPVKKKAANPWKRWGSVAAAALLVALGAWGLSRNSLGPGDLPKPATVSPTGGDLMEARSLPMPEITPDADSLIQGHSADDLNGETQTVEALPSSDSPESQGVPSESQNQALPGAEPQLPAGTSADKSAPIPSPDSAEGGKPAATYAPKRTGDASPVDGDASSGPENPTTGESVPTVDAASVEGVEPSPSEAPNISLFSTSPNLFMSVPSKTPAPTAEDALELLTAYLWPEGLPEDMTEMSYEGVLGYETPFAPLDGDGGQQASTRLEYLGLTENEKYHEFWLYNLLLDDPDTGLAHSSTLNFFAVPLDGGGILTQRVETPDGGKENSSAYQAGIDAYQDATTN